MVPPRLPAGPARGSPAVPERPLACAVRDLSGRRGGDRERRLGRDTSAVVPAGGSCTGGQTKRKSCGVLIRTKGRSYDSSSGRCRDTWFGARLLADDSRSRHETTARSPLKGNRPARRHVQTHQLRCSRLETAHLGSGDALREGPVTRRRA